MPEAIAPDAVKASPTRRFFIAVLIKDIQFLDAVIELVDNSVDAARAYRPDGNLAGLSIDIDFAADLLTIRDNAGGMSIRQAQQYAFRFGRPDDAPETPGSVGEFGVGMKRALFKIGKSFTVRSTTDQETLLVSVDVDAWQAEEAQPGEWTFPMPESGPNTSSLPNGTEINITRLFEYARQELTSNNFGTKLSTSLKQKHAVALAEGLNIAISGNNLQAQAIQLRMSNQIHPLKITKTLDVEGSKVEVMIVAGLAERVLQDTGWYVFCNGRLIERAEQSEKTGWQTALVEGEKKAPRAHWQFAHFRGYVMFSAQKTSVLPWNTTKTGLNIEAPAFRQVRSDMNAAMREVINFLNQREEEGKNGPIDTAIEAAPMVSLDQLPQSTQFSYSPSAHVTQTPKPVRIAFDCEPEMYDAVRSSLGVKSRSDVGRGVFDYYVEAEGIDG